MMVFFAEDGSWGDANNIIVVDKDAFDPDEWVLIEACSDDGGDVYDLVSKLLDR